MRWGTRRLRRTCGALLTVLVGAALLAASAASSGPRLVRIEASAASAHGAPIGPVPAGARMHISVVLKLRDPAGLKRFLGQVSDPSSPLYRQYLTPTQFGRRFGATDSELRAVRVSLIAHGLTPGTAPPDRLSIPVTATAGQVQRAFSVRMERVRLAHGREATVASAAPAVDSAVASDIRAVVGLSSLAAPHPLLLRSSATSRVKAHEQPRVQTGGPQPCTAASTTASQDGAYTADQLASAYGFSGLYGAGDQGQGQTIAVYELEPNDPNDIAAYQACYGTHASVSYVPVDSGAGSGAGSGEAALDIEDLIGLAPRANLIVYQAPNADQSVPNSGPFDLFSAIINDDRANVVSVSWGECEEVEGSSGASAESALFEQAAAEGQSILAASGDSGSEDCDGATNVPDPSLAVDDPASQPFITGVGGTSTSSTGPPPAQSVWNSGGGAGALLGLSSGASGGGVSALWGMPGYQSGAAAGLHVINSRSSSSTCGATAGVCRQVPDVASDADPNTGIVIYYNGSGDPLAGSTGWQPVGGTSAASPVWAAVLALSDASSACHGSPVGFANPALYKAASDNYSGLFNDVTSGNNDFTGTNGGLYPASTGYDMATGLGTPNATPLAAALCQDALRIRDPGARRSTAGQPVTLKLTTTGSGGGNLIWVSNGLPPGLSLGRSTGQITGRPTKLGTFTVAVVVVGANDAVRGAVFKWTIQPAPSISAASIRGLHSGRPRLRMTITAGRGAPGLHQVTIAVPAPLRFARGPVAVTGPGGAHIAERSRIVGGRLQLTLSGAPRRIVVTIAYPAIATSSTSHHAGRLRLRVSVTDSRHETSSLTASVRASS